MAKRVALQMSAQEDADDDYDEASAPPLPALNRAPSSLLSDLTARLPMVPASSPADRIALAVRAATNAAAAATHAVGTTGSNVLMQSGKNGALALALSLHAPVPTTPARTRRHELLTSYVCVRLSCCMSASM
jgi:hypothetical protein